MEILGTVESGITYSYSSKQSIIQLSALVSRGTHTQLKNQFSFSSFTLPDDGNEDNELVFKNGNVDVDGKNYLITKLTIDKKKIFVAIVGVSKIASKLINEIEKIINSNLDYVNIAEKEKKITEITEFKAKFEMSLGKIFNPRLTSLMESMSSHFKAGDFSNISIHYPLWSFAFISKPNVEQIISEVGSEAVEKEIDKATAIKRGYLTSNTPQDFEEGICTVWIETNSDLAISLMKMIEDSLKD